MERTLVADADRHTLLKTTIQSLQIVSFTTTRVLTRILMSSKVMDVVDDTNYMVVGVSVKRAFPALSFQSY